MKCLIFTAIVFMAFASTSFAICIEGGWDREVLGGLSSKNLCEDNQATKREVALFFDAIRELNGKCSLGYFYEVTPNAEVIVNSPKIEANGYQQCTGVAYDFDLRSSGCTTIVCR